jgi:hypothetical protein
MIVAWQFIAWVISRHDPSRRARYDLYFVVIHRRRSNLTSSHRSLSVPYGTGSMIPPFQAFHAWLPSLYPPGQIGSRRSVRFLG